MENIVEWDYYEHVHKLTSIIHVKQYREWRKSGIAFEFGDVVYSEPNRSTSSFVKGICHDGRKQIRGYWLDLLVSPYISFGVKLCPTYNHTTSSFILSNGQTTKENHKKDKYYEDMKEKLFYIANKGTGAAQHRHNTVEVAMYNILSMMWQLEVRSKLVWTNKSSKTNF